MGVMEVLSSQLKAAIGADLRNVDKVGGSLGYRVDEKIPNWEKNSLKNVKLPRKTNDAQVIKLTERASELEGQDELLKRVLEQNKRIRASLVSIRKTRMSDTANAIGTSDQLAFAEASFLKTLGMHQLNQGQAEAEVRGADRAHGKVRGLFG